MNNFCRHISTNTGGILNSATMIKLLTKVLIKFKVIHTFKLYIDYFTMVDLIQAKEKFTILKIKLTYLNVMIKVFHYVLLYCINDSFSPVDHLLHFDITFVENLSSFLNLYIALNYYLIAKVYKLLYYKNNGVLGQFFRRVILQENNIKFNCRLFTKSYFKFGFLVTKVFLFFKYNVNKNKIETNLQKFTQVFLHCMDVYSCLYGNVTLFQ